MSMRQGLMRRGLIAALTAAVLLAPPHQRASANPDDSASEAKHASDSRAAIEGVWEIRINRAKLTPKNFHGLLCISKRGAGFSSDVVFNESQQFTGLPYVVEVEDARPSSVRLSVGSSNGPWVRIDAKIADDRLTGTVEWVGLGMTDPVEGERARVQRFEKEPSSRPFPVETEPEKVGIDPAALDRLILVAQWRKSESLVLVKDGKLICERYFVPRRMHTLQSITKTFASFAIPLLIEDGRFEGDLDQPLLRWFPEWKGDARKEKITLRHVLTHTTGLAWDGTAEMQKQSDFLAYAIASKAVADPGTTWNYNNQAFELLSGLVERITGETCAKYVGRRLLEPLGLKSWRWEPDAAGHTPTFGGIWMDAIDLARFGQMVGNAGELDGEQYIPQAWIRSLLRPGTTVEPSISQGPGNGFRPNVGLAWWIAQDRTRELVTQTADGRRRLKDAGLTASDRLAFLDEITFRSLYDYACAAFSSLPEADAMALQDLLHRGVSPGRVDAPVSGLFHTGSGGQYLLVWSQWNLVLVRQRSGFLNGGSGSAAAEQLAGFTDIGCYLRPCVR